MKQVKIDGEDAENMNQLVRQVAYLNTRYYLNHIKAYLGLCKVAHLYSR